MAPVVANRPDEPGAWIGHGERDPAIGPQVGGTWQGRSIASTVEFQTNADNLTLEPRYEAPVEAPVLDSARPLLGSGQHHRMLMR